MLRFFLGIFLLVVLPLKGIAQQFNLVGSAAQLSCECYRLTDVQPNYQGGSVWNLNQVNLNNPFDFNFRVFLGCSNSPGADGICFVLQNTSINVGGNGGGLGYMNFPNQSIGIELDTYQNTNYGDPVFDHIALESNGSINHNLVAPVQASPVSQDIEDCVFHDFRILWNPANNNLSAYFDGSLRFSYNFPGGLVNSIFNGNSNVYWGFTGATGGETNLQQFCLDIDASFSAGNNYSYCDPNNIPFVSGSQSGLNAIVSYLWDFGDGNSSSSQNPTHSYAGPGSYMVSLTVTDQSGCTNTETHQVDIFEPPAGTVSTVDAGCGAANTGSATLTLSAGQAPFTVNVSSGGSTTSSGNVFTASGLAAGSHFFTITDANGCTEQINFQINSISGFVLNETVSPISCNGAADGQISLNPSGATPPYSFELNGLVQPTLSASSLPPGAYSVLVTDASGCTSTYNFSLTDPLPLQLNVLSVSDVQCFGMNNGSVSSSGSGGTQPYSFSFGSQTSGNGSFSALAPGIYTLLLTDANGCTQQQNVTINEPPLLSLNVVQVTDPACYGMSNGSISLSATGGVPGYSFQVGSASNAAGLFLNLSAGNYSVIVSDNQSCTSSLTITLNQPPELQIQTISASDPLCSGDANGSIQITVSGGTVMAGYQYSWNTSPVQTSQNINNLPAGTYSVTITDVVGCTVQGSWVLNDPSFALNPFPDQQICEGDSLILMAGYLGGANPVSVQWTDLNTGQSYNTELLQLLPVNSTDFQITATDANGCVAIPLGFQLTILPSAIPSFTVSETQGCAPLCVTFNGSASLPGAQLSWLTGDGSAYSGQTNLIHCYQSPGLFDLTLAAITAEGCTTKVNADDFIAVGANPVADFSFSQSSIFLDEGSVFISDINPQSGFELSWIAPFEIEWKENKGLITLSDSGNYCVTLAASNDFGCADTVRKCFRAELPYRLFIPSAFTPNSDGRNEIFLPEGGPFKEIEMSLYDRWGRTIYREAGRSLHGWTGEGFPQGVYVYLISAKDSEGVAHEYKGTVTLYR